MWKAKVAKNVSAVLALADDVAVTAWHVVADARVFGRSALMDNA